MGEDEYSVSVCRICLILRCAREKEGRLKHWSRGEAHTCSWHRHRERVAGKGVARDSAGKSGLHEREMEEMHFKESET